MCRTSTPESVEPGLLDRFAQGSSNRAVVLGVYLPTWKRRLPGVRPHVMCSLDQQHIGTAFSLAEEHEYR